MKRHWYVFILICSFFASLQGIEELPYEEAASNTFRVVLTARHRTLLSSQVSSVVTEINKQMGEAFKEGDILIHFDDTVFYAAETKALALLERSRVKLQATQELFKDSASSLLELKEAEVDVATAESELVHATKTLTSCTIKAPYDGYVDTLHVDIHEMVQPGQELCEIVDSSVLIGKVLIPSQLLQGLSLGEELVIDVGEVKKKVIGKVSSIGAVIDPVSSIVKVHIEVDNAQGELKPGMIGLTSLIKAAS